MKNFTLTIAFAVMFIQCNKNKDAKPFPSNKDSSHINSETVKTDSLDAKTFCYLGITGKDSVFVRLDDNLGTISGKMSYKNFEKDSSKGELSGFKSGDTLKLTYEFASEGTVSKRDIFFIQKDNSLTEGIGNHKDDKGTMRYSDEKKIDYKNGQELKSADCALIAKALK